MHYILFQTLLYTIKNKNNIKCLILKKKFVSFINHCSHGLNSTIIAMFIGDVSLLHYLHNQGFSMPSGFDIFYADPNIYFRSNILDFQCFEFWLKYNSDHVFYMIEYLIRQNNSKCLHFFFTNPYFRIETKHDIISHVRTAIRCDNINFVQFMHKEGLFTVNKKFIKNHDLYHLASWYNSINCLKFLHKIGPNFDNIEFESVYHMLVFDCFECFKYMSENNAPWYYNSFYHILRKMNYDEIRYLLPFFIHGLKEFFMHHIRFFKNTFDFKYLLSRGYSFLELIANLSFLITIIMGMFTIYKKLFFFLFDTFL